MSEQGVFRFARDTPSRIAGTTGMMTLGAEVLPGEQMYQPIPFFPPSIIDGSGSSLTSSTSPVQTWATHPSRCDLSWYQGDDVTIPFFFDNPEDTDMSDQDGFSWHADVRVLHSYRSELLYEFSIDSVFIPAVEDDEVDLTKVTLFLPRSENVYVGRYRWDLYSISLIEEDMSEFPEPPDWPDTEPWPPVTKLRTWLYGEVTIYPRVTDTDFLPGDVVVAPVPPPYGDSYTMGFFAGPNGRVP